MTADERRGFALGLEQASEIANAWDADGLRTVDDLANDIHALQPDPSLVVVERAQLEKVKNCIPASGFPLCTEKCLRQTFWPDEQPCCVCGNDEARHYFAKALTILDAMLRTP